MKKVLKMAKETDLAESKGEIIAYLQTAQDIEKDIYTLETSCEELEKKAQEEDKFAERVLHEYNYSDTFSGTPVEELQRSWWECDTNAKNPYEHIRGKLRPTNLKIDYKPENFPKSWGKYFIKYLSTSLLVSLIIIIAIFTIDVDAGVYFAQLGLLFSIIISAVGAHNKKERDQITAAASENAKNKEQNQKNERENDKIRNNYVAEQREKMEKLDQEIAKEKAIIADEHTANAQYYREQVENVKKDLEPLYRNRIKFYSDGVVPVDYRTMDCVYVLEQIFRNDLADTMREAVLMYEERVFRGEIIRGMANIAAHIDNLSSVMSRLRTDIDRISRDVAIMREDMDQIYEDNREFADDIKKSNDKLYMETKMHRHALEALDNSNRALLGYAEKDRQSLEELAKSNQKLVDYIEDN